MNNNGKLSLSPRDQGIYALAGPPEDHLENPEPSPFHPDDLTHWQTVQVDDIATNALPQAAKNLFLADPLLKSHRPSLLFENVRQGLDDRTYFAFRATTAENLKTQLIEKYPAPVFGVYYFFHYLLRRVLPKAGPLKRLYQSLKLPVDMSKAEIMGRLMYHGLEIVQIRESFEETVFVTQRSADVAPSTYAPPPREGILFTTRRVGKNNERIKIYKLRSMHPFAEYVQAYMHRENGLDKGGKFKDDYRVSTGGRLIRKYWIDELPMLYNLLRGDLKMIGVRPLSEHYLSLYPERLRALRARHKPGLIPPFYADLPQEFDEIVESELKYLEAYEQAPLRTDLNYLSKILRNIFIRRARSK